MENIKNSIKNISNVNDFCFKLKMVIPKISLEKRYYFILIFEDNIQYKTDYLDFSFDENMELDIDINNYKRIRKTKNIMGEFTTDYIIDDYTIQEILYYILDDNNLFFHNKFTNVYYSKDDFIIYKHNNYYNSVLFSRYFDLRDYIDVVFIMDQKIKRKYNKKLKV